MRSRIALLLLAIALAVPALGQTKAPEPRYVSITVAGKRAGYGRLQTSPDPAGFKQASDCEIKVNMLGTAYDMRYQAIALYKKLDDPIPLRYTISLVAGPSNITSDVRFTGKKIEIAYSRNGAKEHRSLDQPAECYMLEGNLLETWERILAHVTTTPGKAHTVKVVSAATADISPLTITWRSATQAEFGVGGSTLTATWNARTKTITKLSIPDQQADFIAADKSAMSGLEAIEAASRAFAVSDVSFDNPEAVDNLTIQLNATVAGERIAAETLNTPWQSFKGVVNKNSAKGMLTVRKFRYDGKGSAAYPLTPALKKRFADDLKPATYIECDDPEIKQLAQKLAKGSLDVWSVTQRICKWVNQNIAYKISGVGAKACLQAKSGDCGPHSWLSIALLRAAGIPARITGGAVYNGLLGGSFGQHYWTQAWIGEKQGWVPIDTTSGEIGTLSATHLNLWKHTGGIAALSVKVVSYSPKNAPRKPVAGEIAVARKAIGLKANDTWSYRMVMDGKEIGTETARVDELRADGSARIGYKLDVTVSGGAALLEGTLDVTADGGTTSLYMKATQGGIVQAVTAKVEGDKVRATIEGAGLKNDRVEEMPAGGFLTLGNLAFGWDLMLRSLTLDPGRSIQPGCYMVDALKLARPKLDRLTDGTVKLAGVDTACAVIENKASKERWYLSKETGHLLKRTVGDGKIAWEAKP